MLAYEQVLCYYNPERHLKLSWDASHMALTVGVFCFFLYTFEEPLGEQKQMMDTQK